MITTLRFCLVVLTCLLAIESTRAQARIQASASSWDFGVRDQGEKDQKIIQLKNVGERILVIKKVSATCGCVEPMMEPGTEIRPGESTPLVLDLDTNKGEGEIEKFVVIESNDPVEPKLMLAMKGLIKPIWWIDTQSLVFGEVKNGEPARRRVTIHARRPWKVELKKVLAHPEDRLKLTTTPFGAEGEDYGWYVDVELVGRVETGYFEGIILVETDWKDRPQRGFRVVAEIVTSTRVAPANLPFGLLKKGEKKTLTFQIDKQHGSGLRVADVVAKDQRIHTELETIEEGKSYKVRVTLDAGADAGEIRGTIEVGLDEPGWVVQTVSYYAKVVD